MTCLTALKRNGEIIILDDKGRELDKHKVPYGANIYFNNGDTVKPGDRARPVGPAPRAHPRREDGHGELRRHRDRRDRARRRHRRRREGKLVVIEHKGEKHPQIVIQDAERQDPRLPLPARQGAHRSQGRRIKIKAGHMLARQPRGSEGSQDIVGGLPRVTEIFEARKPKDPAVMAEISGRVELLSDKRKGKMTIRIISESGIEKDHHVPQDRHLLVHAGDAVNAGDPLIEGPLVPHDILRIKGEEALYNYMLDEVQNVYRAQGVPINDKHIEVILAQMLRKVRVENIGDTDLLPHDVMDQARSSASPTRSS